MTTYTPSPRFQEAAAYLSNSSSVPEVSNTIKLELYGLFKYLTTSHAPNTARPSIINFTGRVKWDAWKQAESAYGEKDQVAEERYLQLAKDLGWVEGVALVDTSEASSTARSGDGENEDDIWDDEETSKRYKSSGGGMGNTLSTMAAGEEDGRREDSPHQFAISGDTEGLKALLQSHAEIDLNAVDEYGYTPLHLASDRGHLPVVELLLASNVDLSIKDSDDFTALELARIAEHEDVVAALMKVGT